MKNKLQLTAALCALALCAALTGCGGAASSAVPSATPAPTAEPTAEPTPEASAPAAEPAEPAAPDAALVAQLDAIYAAQPVELSLDTRTVDLSDASWVRYYTGLESADKIDAAIASEPMIGSQAYSVVLLRCKDAADAAEVAQGVAEGIDPRKWICVIADDGRVVTNGDTVMLAMVETSLSDVVTAEQLVAAFTTAIGTPEVDLSIATAVD